LLYFFRTCPGLSSAAGTSASARFNFGRERPDIAELVVFELDALNAGPLALNVWNWGKSPVRVMRMALGERIGEATLARNPSNTGDNRMWKRIPASLESGGDDPKAWPRQNAVVVGLDEIWRGSLDLLLLDTQWWEPDVLAGARRLILEQRPAIVFEWWPRALAARGVDCYDVLTWLERDLRLRVDIVPLDAWKIQAMMLAAADMRDARELTRLLLEHPEPTVR
jgi:FkbM family methyltransferase